MKTQNDFSGLNESEIRTISIESAERYLRSKYTNEPHLLYAVKPLTNKDTAHLEQINQRLKKD
jgi:hypothetical protein